MKTPVNGPITEYGSAMTTEALNSPTVVLCLSGENTTDAISETWKSPSANWLASRTRKSRRKSGLRSASRVRSSVPFAAMARIVGPAGLNASGGTTATASISMRASGCTSPLISTSVLAGGSAARNSRRTSRIAGSPPRSVTYVSIFTTSPNVAPFAERMARRFSNTFRVCAPTSSTPTNVPSASIASCPEM